MDSLHFARNKQCQNRDRSHAGKYHVLNGAMCITSANPDKSARALLQAMNGWQSMRVEVGNGSAGIVNRGAGGAGLFIESGRLFIFQPRVYFILSTMI